MALSCVTRGPSSEASVYYASPVDAVMGVAADILRAEGYTVDVDRTFGLVEASRERLSQSRQGPILADTLVRRQVVLECEERGDGAVVRGTFNVTTSRRTGERRTFQPESGYSRNLRRRFYQKLAAELGVDVASAQSR